MDQRKTTGTPRFPAVAGLTPMLLLSDVGVIGHSNNA